MNSDPQDACQALHAITVGEVMNRRVAIVRASDDMAHAAAALAEANVSGAPVVDEMGRCVGVLSGADFVDREGGRAAAGESAGPMIHVLSHAAGALEIDSIADDRVSAHMNPVVQTIAEGASLYDAGVTMCAEHVHRLIVVDGARPIGVVSSLDVVAAAVSACRLPAGGD